MLCSFVLHCSGQRLAKQIRNCEIEKIPGKPSFTSFLIIVSTSNPNSSLTPLVFAVIGERERDAKELAVRLRKTGDIGKWHHHS